MKTPIMKSRLRIIYFGRKFTPSSEPSNSVTSLSTIRILLSITSRKSILDTRRKRNLLSRNLALIWLRSYIRPLPSPRSLISMMFLLSPMKVATSHRDDRTPALSVSAHLLARSHLPQRKTQKTNSHKSKAQKSLNHAIQPCEHRKPPPPQRTEDLVSQAVIYTQFPVIFRSNRTS